MSIKYEVQWGKRGKGGVSGQIVGGSHYDIEIDGVTYRVHVIADSLDVAVLTDTVADWVLVGGGGGGSAYGGGGAGGVIKKEGHEIAAGSYPAVIGKGGEGGEGGENGDHSEFLGRLAIGGGSGGSHGSSSPSQPGQDGGSGGGAGARSSYPGGSALQPGYVDGGLGHDGGEYVTDNSGGGGGGAGEPGEDGTDEKSGDGGDGIDLSDKFGTDVGVDGWLAAGGGGGAWPSDVDAPGSGGKGGGGDGGYNDGEHTSGVDGTGSGGGGYGQSTSAGGGGGDGVLLIRYVLEENEYPLPHGETGDYTTEEDIADTHFDLTGLEAGQLYEWRVRAIIDDEPRDWSAWQGFETADGEAPDDRSGNAVIAWQGQVNPKGTRAAFGYSSVVAYSAVSAAGDKTEGEPDEGEGAADVSASANLTASGSKSSKGSALAASVAAISAQGVAQDTDSALGSAQVQSRAAIDAHGAKQVTGAAQAFGTATISAQLAKSTAGAATARAAATISADGQAIQYAGPAGGASIWGLSSVSARGVAGRQGDSDVSARFHASEVAFTTRSGDVRLVGVSGLNMQGQDAELGFLFGRLHHPAASKSRLSNPSEHT